jgi:hypothetical protein
LKSSMPMAPLLNEVWIPSPSTAIFTIYTAIPSRKSLRESCLWFFNKRLHKLINCSLSHEPL